jgi:hypothetical protein
MMRNARAGKLLCASAGKTTANPHTKQAACFNQVLIIALSSIGSTNHGFDPMPCTGDKPASAYP